MESAQLVVNFALPEKEKTHKKLKFPVFKTISFIFLLIFCILWISPFFIMFFGSLRGHYDAQYFPSELFPPHSGLTLENFKMLLLGEYPDDIVHNTTTYPIWNWFINSCFSAIGGTLLYLIIASFTAYTFVFVDFKYRKYIFAFLIATLVIPGTATSVGNQSFVYSIGLNNSILALIIPGLGGVYGMYLIKTFFESIPKDLVESAKMDGCSNISIFAKIVFPLGKTAIYVQGLFGFMGGWNDLVWPQMLFGAKDNHLWTLQVGMAYIINNSKTADLIGTALASGVICFLPVLVVYLIAQNKIIEGMATAGIKR